MVDSRRIFKAATRGFSRLFFPRRGRRATTSVAGGQSVINYGGYLQQEDLSPLLATRERRYRVYEDLLANTPIISVGIRYYQHMISGASWKFVPADGDSDYRYAEMAREMLMRGTGRSWGNIIRQLSMFRAYGFAVLEWTYGRRGGMYIYDGLDIRMQSTITRWHQDGRGRVMGVVQEIPNSGDESYIPRWKIVHLVDDGLLDSPEGYGIFRHLVDPGRRLQRYTYLEGIGFETDLRGIPIAYAPLRKLYQMVQQHTMDQATMDKLLHPLKAFLEGHERTTDLSIMLDSSPYSSTGDSQSISPIREWEMNLLTGSSTSFQENAAAIVRLNWELARILGVEQIMLGSTAQGSYALSKDQTERSYQVVNDALREIREAIADQLLEPIWMANGMPMEMMPSIEVSTVRYNDMETLSMLLEGLVAAGVRLNEEVYAAWLSELGIKVVATADGEIVRPGIAPLTFIEPENMGDGNDTN